MEIIYSKASNLVQKWSKTCTCFKCNKNFLVVLGSDGSCYDGQSIFHITPYSNREAFRFCDKCTSDREFSKIKEALI